ncbi:MAG: hypothetical protein HWE10_07605 [Gammaproteobacteria bacterium]|nr:hypothetical protein [Gammaproteobacteria bacterium]
MQSLILATSLILSTQAPVTASDVSKDIESFVNAETQRVSKAVEYHVQLAAQDTFLYQAKLVISQAKRDRAAQSFNDEAAE